MSYAILAARFRDRFGPSPSPAVLLLICGTLIGMNFPFGKIAGDAGVSPLLWAGLVSLGVLILLLPMQFDQPASRPSLALLRFSAVSALVSFVVPNTLLYAVIPQVGAGYAGLMFALSPVFTLLLAAMLGMKTPGTLGRIGIALGLIGAILISLTRGTGATAPDPRWLLGAVAVPVALATGNVYRSRCWPEGARPHVLAFWGHALSTLLFLVLIFLVHGGLPLAPLRSVAPVAIVQMLLAGLTFPVFYRLQRDGGPVLLSQIGYVAAATGLLAATVFLGESYSAATWLGACIIGLGILATILANRSKS